MPRHYSVGRTRVMHAVVTQAIASDTNVVDTNPFGHISHLAFSLHYTIIMQASGAKPPREKDPAVVAARKAKEAQRKRDGRQFNTEAAERERARDRERKMQQSLSKKEDSVRFNHRFRKPYKSDPFPKNGTALFQVQVITHASTDRFVNICHHWTCCHPVEFTTKTDRTKPEYCTGPQRHRQPQDRASQNCVPVKLTNPTDPSKTYVASIIDRRLARTIYDNVDVLDPDSTDYKQMLRLKAFKGPIKKMVTTTRIGYNTFIVGLHDPPSSPMQPEQQQPQPQPEQLEHHPPEQQPAQQQQPEDHFHHAAYTLHPGHYPNVELRLYPTNNPTIPMNNKPTPCCPMEITTSDGKQLTTAIVDDSVFDALPYKEMLGSPLSMADIPQVMSLLGNITNAILADIDVVPKYGTTIISKLTYNALFL